MSEYTPRHNPELSEWNDWSRLLTKVNVLRAKLSIPAVSAEAESDLDALVSEVPKIKLPGDWETFSVWERLEFVDRYIQDTTEVIERSMANSRGLSHPSDTPDTPNS